MRPATRDSVDAWWRAVFGVGDELWSAVTVHPHGYLADYPGWYVAWSGSGVHVSTPTTAAADEVAWLAEQGVDELTDPENWQAFARQRGLELIGPSTHAYLDLDPGPDDEVVELGRSDLELLRVQVRPAEWTEAGMSHEPAPPLALGLVRDGGPVAAAVLNLWDGTPRDIGVVVAERHRGRGLAARVGAAATSYAVRRHGIARWRAATSNLASVRTAERVGFVPYATQLAIRSASA
jgi:GNAT superfamily N-acetyltransferase